MADGEGLTSAGKGRPPMTRGLPRLAGTNADVVAARRQRTEGVFGPRPAVALGRNFPETTDMGRGLPAVGWLVLIGDAPGALYYRFMIGVASILSMDTI
jgi:hypothetical protein